MGILTFRTVATLLALPWLALALSPPVKVSLKTSWRSTPLLLEIIECAASETHDAYFTILDLLTSQGSSALSTKQATYQSSLNLLNSNGFFNLPGSQDSFELSVALHVASPRIQAYYQYYHDSCQAAPDGCTSWIDWYGELFCDGPSFKSAFAAPGRNSSSRPHLFSFDRIYPSPSTTLISPSHTAVLYADVASPNFRDLHSTLLTLASERINDLQYVIRYVPPTGHADAPTESLAGYGVAMDLKKMDYLAVDDRKTGGKDNGKIKDTTGKKESGPRNAEQALFLDELVSTTDPDTLAQPLSEEDINALGTQTAQVILNSDNPWAMLEYLSQNFPKYAQAIARSVEIDDNVAQEFLLNQRVVGPGLSAIWLNGMLLSETDLNVFSLLSQMRQERLIVNSLVSTGLSGSEALDVMTHNIISKSQTESDVTDGIFDASDRLEGGNVCVWFNDIEKDSRYSKWKEDMIQLLMPLYPGQFPRVRKNIFNVVMVLDLSQGTSLNFIAGTVSQLISRQYPFRFGVVPIIETEDGLRAARLFYYMIDNYGRAVTMNLFRTLVAAPRIKIDFELTKREFEKIVAQAMPRTEGATIDFDTIVRGGSEEDEIRMAQARGYSHRLGTTLASSSLGHAFLNGKHFVMDDEFLRSLQVETSAQMEYLQRQVQNMKISSDTPMDVYFYDLPTAIQKRNRHIFPSSTTRGLKIVNLPDVFAKTGYQSELLVAGPTPLTIWVVADFDDGNGLALLKEAIGALIIAQDVDSSFRLGLVFNSNSSLPETVVESNFASVALFRLLKATQAASEASLEHYSSFVDFLLRREWRNQPLDKVMKDWSLSEVEGFSAARTKGSLLARELGFNVNDRGIVINGRVLGPIEPNGFAAIDFTTLTRYERRKRVQPVVEALEDLHVGFISDDKEALWTAAPLVSSIIGDILIPDPSAEGLFKAAPRPRQRSYHAMRSQTTFFMVGDNTTSILQFAIIVNPLHEFAQKWSTILSRLSESDAVSVEVYLNPAIGNLETTELPLKRFYRFSLPTSLEFDEQGHDIPPAIEFEGLPPDPIYTLGMDVAQSWLVRPRESQHDLDNIYLAGLVGAEQQSGVEAIFSLDYLVIEGHARESLTMSPPRGLQLQLSTIRERSPVDDTLVVANLGYIQFKAKPGVFILEIRPGRGQTIYEIESVGNEGWNSPAVTDSGAEITLTSFEGLTLYPRFVKRPNMENEDVLEDPRTGQPGFFDKFVSQIYSVFGHQKKDSEAKSTQADINIFTVASGHLYERFASIMILSVLRNTKSSVKFWFIENFLSPSFLEFIPHFAEEYGFQYELVTYKWPSWLRAQKEKQRIIWGYKILFLDVLFPMDLKKVIFVDADQIVRADLKELVDLNLHGAPYGYTPMGDDNEAMEGFRFWKQGYWKEHLMGKPYHISALYVIDLVRFRQFAAGDKLRGQYQGLSADPHSLANLDQDLPNNLQHDVPIYSLHEDWLWCETWCSKDRFDRAKTIDLCQNPLTKEPKLSRARQIPEWESLDAEIARFARKLADEGKIRSDAAAAGADSLANIGKATSKSTTHDDVSAATEEQNSADGGRHRTTDQADSGAGGTAPVRDEL